MPLRSRNRQSLRLPWTMFTSQIQHVTGTDVIILRRSGFGGKPVPRSSWTLLVMRYRPYSFLHFTRKSCTAPSSRVELGSERSLRSGTVWPGRPDSARWRRALTLSLKSGDVTVGKRTQ